MLLLRALVKGLPGGRAVGLTSWVHRKWPWEMKTFGRTCHRPTSFRPPRAGPVTQHGRVQSLRTLCIRCSRH